MLRGVDRSVLYRLHNLPSIIPMTLGAFAFILTIHTGTAVASVQALNLRSVASQGSSKFSATWVGIALVLLTVIYDTTIATLGATYIAPSSTLRCQLENQWASFFSNKNVGAIRGIQDRHECCGLFNAHDRAWPFPDRRHDAYACQEAFGRDQSCFAAWRRDQQITGGLILLIAIVAFLTQVNSRSWAFQNKMIDR